jgi:hypothetical protein
MSWQSLGTVTPKENQWLDYAPTTQAPDSPVESLPYRFTGLNVETFDPDRFFALVRFKYGEGIYSRERRIDPSPVPSVLQVGIPAEISSFPFSWVPQIQLIYLGPKTLRKPINWSVRIDSFNAVAASASDFSRFLY